MRPMAKETHIKTDKNPLSAGVLGSYDLFLIVVLQPETAKGIGNLNYGTA